MLESYFQPHTVDRIRAAWIAAAVEQYVAWLESHAYSARIFFRRVPIVLHFGDFARNRGATSYDDLPAHVDAFVESWVAERPSSRQPRQRLAMDARIPVEQMLRLVVLGQDRRASKVIPEPFHTQAPDFFEFLQREKGLRSATIRLYRSHLRRLEGFLAQAEVRGLSSLSPVLLSAFVANAGQKICKKGLCHLCSALRVFLRYLYSESVLPRDLSGAVEAPNVYRLSDIPRAISWDEVRRLLEGVDRRTALGKRDYAMLLLMVTYGLRAQEIARLTLDDIDWKRDRLRVPERKAGHSTAFPLSAVVGTAILDYLQHGRHQTPDRHLFFTTMAPYRPLTYENVSQRVSRHLQRAGIVVARAGSHTLRHTCVQRLVDADFQLHVIGDYVGHRSPDSTRIYSKVAVTALREVATGDVEDLL